jgi:hypothetical protein
MGTKRPCNRLAWVAWQVGKNMQKSSIRNGGPHSATVGLRDRCSGQTFDSFWRKGAPNPAHDDSDIYVANFSSARYRTAVAANFLIMASSSLRSLSFRVVE